MGWKHITKKSYNNVVGCQYGFFPLNESQGVCELLVFGGINNNFPNETMTRTSVLTINCRQLEMSKIESLQAYGASKDTAKD